MTDDEIDRILGGEDDVVPTSGFHASVMEAIPPRGHGTAADPLSLEARVARVRGDRPRLRRIARSAGQAGEAAPDLESLRLLAQSVGAPWIALATLSTVLSLLLSRRLASERY
jgi:hypothetical protein